MEADAVSEKRKVVSKNCRRAAERETQIRGEMLAIQFKMPWKPIQNKVQIEFADDTDTKFALAAHSTSPAIGSIKRLHGDLLLKLSNIIQSGGTRRIGQAIRPAAGCCKPYCILR